MCVCVDKSDTYKRFLSLFYLTIINPLSSDQMSVETYYIWLDLVPPYA